MSKSETFHTAEFLLSEGNGTISRETVTIDDGNLVAGTVLGMITATRKYVQHSPTANNGSQHAVAVLYQAVDATDGDKRAVAIIRYAEVSDSHLTWADGITAVQKETAIGKLADNGVIVR